SDRTRVSTAGDARAAAWACLQSRAIARRRARHRGGVVRSSHRHAHQEHPTEDRTRSAPSALYRDRVRDRLPLRRVMTPGWHRQRRPPWWPENEPWPPLDRSLWIRRSFLFRVGGFFILAIVFGSLGLARFFCLLAERTGFHPPGAAIALSTLVRVSVVVPSVFFGGMRRFGFPLGDIVDAADRVGRGDYSTRIIERGPPFLRKLARACNAMATRLEAQEQQRRNLMADVAHELRTPLSVMRGRLEGLLDGVYVRDDATPEQLMEQTKLLERLVEDLRTLAHAEGGTLRLQRESTDLGVLIPEVARSFRAARR